MFAINQSVEIYKDGIRQGLGTIKIVSGDLVNVGGRWYNKHTGISKGFSYSHYVISVIDEEHD